MAEPVPGTLAEALARLQGRLPRVAKEHTAKVDTKTGGSYRYAYADLTDVSAALLPIMSSLGLSFSAKPMMADGKFVLRYILRHVSGESDGGDYPLPDPERYGPQDLGKAESYARRYSLIAITGLAPGGDDDDAASAEQAHHDASKPVPRTGTNAELRASGQMDRKQKAAHEQLEADTLRGQGHAERSHPRGPDPDDPWAADAPVDGERAAALRATMAKPGQPYIAGRDLTDPEDKPGTRTAGQHRAIEMLLGKLGLPSEARTDRHMAVAALLDMAGLASFDDLSFTQAAEAIRLLQAELAKDKAGA